MEKKHDIKIYIDPIGNTLNFWWGDPQTSAYSQEAKHSWDLIVMNKENKPIGFEKIGFFPKEIEPVQYLTSQMDFFLEARERHGE